MKMISTSLNNSLPLSKIGPQWAGVRVLVTETGLDSVALNASPFGFNLGTHVGDELASVQKRRVALEAELGAPILWLNQVHSCDVHIVNDLPASIPPSADASVTNASDVALAIMTADCLPVVFAAFNDHGTALGVAAAHAGWRGLHAGVLQATALALSDRCQVPATQVKVWMGPAIGPGSFEVGQEVFDAFDQQSPLNKICFKPRDMAGKYLADIYGLARLALNSVGLQTIEGGGLDTLTDSRWFSHRRGQQQQLPAGRFATLIRLLPGQDA